MENEKIENELTENEVDYIQAINDLKASTVDKNKYLQLQAENKKLLNSLVNGSEFDGVEKTKPADIDEIRKEIFTKFGEMSSLEGFTKVLQVRDGLIARGERDPFLPVGQNSVPTKEQIELSEMGSSVFKECIDYSNGDSRIFTNEFLRHIMG